MGNGFASASASASAYAYASGRLVNYLPKYVRTELGTNRYSDACLTELQPYLEVTSSESKIMKQSKWEN